MANPEQRVAILLNLLGDEVSESVLTTIPENRAARVRERLAAVKKDHPSSREIDDVLGEFQRFFHLVARQESPRLRVVGGVVEEGPGESNRNGSTSDTSQVKRSFPKVEPTDDPVADLNRLDPAQIAAALKGEHPRSVSIVIKNLPATKAIETMGLLPEETRGAAFVQLKDDVAESGDIIQRIVATTVAKAVKLEPDDIEERDTVHDMAEMLRGMQKKTRAQLLRSLEEEDAELSERIRELLFVFDDVMRLDGRSLQQLLGEVESDVLCIALKGAEDKLVEKVLGCLSKRARLTLEEEMEYQPPSEPEVIEKARKDIAAVMVRLDEEGKLVMTS
jgi:flagellar motor switch protein FliG